MPTPKRTVTWSPQPDITTYELALCLNVFAAANRPHGDPAFQYDKLPPEAQRHWKLQE